jgi:hypothetical protein
MNDTDLHARSEALIGALRDIGLYEDDVEWHPHPEKPLFMLTLQLYLGDVAFSKRVQDADQHTMDQEFNLLASSARREMFEEMRARIQSGDLTI